MNLLPPAVINQRKIKQYFQMMAALWVVFSLVFFLVAAVMDVMIRYNRDECAALARQNKDERYLQSDRLAKSLQAEEEWIGEMRGLMTELDFGENIATRELRQVIAMMPEGMRMRTVVADKEDAILRVEGFSTDRFAVAAYMEALAGRLYDASLLSMDVETTADDVKASSMNADGGGGFAFVIEIKWEDAPDG